MDSASTDKDAAAHWTRLRVAAAEYVSALDGASPIESALRHDCEVPGCTEPVVHAEHWGHKIRYWCAKDTPWSGHYEHCGDTCEALCCDGGDGQ